MVLIYNNWQHSGVQVWFNWEIIRAWMWVSLCQHVGGIWFIGYQNDHV